MTHTPIRIEPYAAFCVRYPDDAGLAQVFFEASAAKTFADDAARRAFRDLWLTSYLTREPEHAYVACDVEGRAVGYLVGSFQDPARNERLAKLTYFADFADMTRDFPAELHVNVTEAARGQGIGARLIERFVEDASAAKVPGVHVVTGATSRNVSFYRRNGFSEKGATKYKGTELVFLGRAI